MELVKDILRLIGRIIAELFEMSIGLGLTVLAAIAVGLYFGYSWLLSHWIYDSNPAGYDKLIVGTLFSDIAQDPDKFCDPAARSREPTWGNPNNTDHPVYFFSCQLQNGVSYSARGTGTSHFGAYVQAVTIAVPEVQVHPGQSSLQAQILANWKHWSSGGISGWFSMGGRQTFARGKTDAFHGLAKVTENRDMGQLGYSRGMVTVLTIQSDEFDKQTAKWLADDEAHYRTN